MPLAAMIGARIWFERVPSFSNIADAPSRFDFSYLTHAGFIRSLPVVPEEVPRQFV